MYKNALPSNKCMAVYLPAEHHHQWAHIPSVYADANVEPNVALAQTIPERWERKKTGRKMENNIHSGVRARFEKLGGPRFLGCARVLQRGTLAQSCIVDYSFGLCFGYTQRKMKIKK